MSRIVIRRNSAQFGTIRFNSAQFGVIRLNAAQSGSVRITAIPRTPNSDQFGALRVNSAQFGAIRRKSNNSAQFCSSRINGLVIRFSSSQFGSDRIKGSFDFGSFVTRHNTAQVVSGRRTAVFGESLHHCLHKGNLCCVAFTGKILCSLHTESSLASKCRFEFVFEIDLHSGPCPQRTMHVSLIILGWT